MSPQRIQRKRSKGWKLPEGARCVTRGSRWGNHFRVDCGSVIGLPWSTVSNRRMDAGVRANVVGEVLYVSCSNDRAAAAHSVDLFRSFCEVRLRDTPEEFEHWIAPLRGLDLACYCPIGEPCHADYLLSLANSGGVG